VKVTVRWQGRKEDKEIEEGATILDLLKRYGILRETVVVFVNGRIVPEENSLEEGDEVVIHPIASGG